MDPRFRAESRIELQHGIRFEQNFIEVTIETHVMAS